MTSIQVSVRVRPFNGREKKYNSKLIIHMKGPVCEINQVKQGKVLDSDPRKFTFDHSFWTHDPSDQDTFEGQEKVYQTIGKSILDNSLSGFNSCLFAYGQTGSGKTYTMMGIPSDPGVIPRLARDLFARAEALKATTVITVEVSYLEIYNEQIRDLLNPAQGDKPLKARQHPKLGVYVENLTKLSASSTEEIEKFIEDGALVRSVASTNMNAQSSRSHAILTLNIRVKKTDNEVASQLHLVDLAGSERAGSTGAEGATLVEGANINKSLTTLGMCLSRLAEVSAAAAEGKKGGHIPFRDSQLTWLLNQSLGGNSKTAMLANISPADINYEETLGTLRFAATTKKIKNNAIVNEDPQQKLIKDLRAEIAKIRLQIEAFDAGNPEAFAIGAPGVDGDGNDEDDYDDYGDDAEEEESAGQGEGGAGLGNAAADKLSRELTLNMNLMMNVIATEQEKADADRATKQERAEAMKKLKGGNPSEAQGKNEGSKKPRGVKQGGESSTVDNTQPRMITLNEDLHALPTVALLYYLPNGDNWVGTEPPKPRTSSKSPTTTPQPEGSTIETTLVHLPSTGCGSKEKLFPKHFALRCNPEKRTVELVVPRIYRTQEEEAAMLAATQRKDKLEAHASGGDEVVANGEDVDDINGQSIHRDPMAMTTGGTVIKAPALVFVNGQPVNLEASTATTKEAASVATPEDHDENGVKEDTDTPSLKEDTDTASLVVVASLNHMDRIVVGSVAFRFSRPAEWTAVERQLELDAKQKETSTTESTMEGDNSTILGDEEEFSRRADTLNHLQHLQDYDRLKVERCAAQDLQHLLDLQFPEEAPAKDLATEWVSVMNYTVGESEIRMVQFYPKRDDEDESLDVLFSTDRHQGLQFDYSYAINERNGYFRELERVTREKVREAARIAREKELEAIQTETDAKEAEIDALRQQLEDAQAAEIAKKKQQAEEEALALEKKLAEEKELEAVKEAGKAAVVGLAATTEKALESTTAGGEGSGGSAPPTSKASSPALTQPAQSAQKKMTLMKQLQQYEEASRMAKEWKPSGPTDLQDAADYRAANQGPTLDSLRNKLDLKAELQCSKFRIKKKLFGSSQGYIPVLLVVRARFIYWYELEDPKKGKAVQAHKPEGACYIWGCDMQRVDPKETVACGKKYCIRIVPCVPRGGLTGSGGAKGAKTGGDDNHVVFSFEEEGQCNGFESLVKDLAEPECPSNVAEYLASMESVV